MATRLLRIIHSVSLTRLACWPAGAAGLSPTLATLIPVSASALARKTAAQCLVAVCVGPMCGAGTSGEWTSACATGGGRSPAIFASARTPSRAGFAGIASSGARARRPFDPSLRTAGCSAQIPRLDARQQKPPFALRASSQPWPQIVGSDPVGGGGGGFGGTVILQPKRPSFFNTYADCLVDACGEAGGDWCEQ